MKSREKRMLIAGGGTGGHLFPGIAVAEEFLSRSPSHRVLFAGTARGLETSVLPEEGYELALIRSRGIARMGVYGKVKGLLFLLPSFIDALKLVRSFKPHLALGVGGYVSGPVLLASWLFRVPCAIQEQNAVPGFTNRILGLFARRVFISFPGAAAWFKRAERKGRVELTGNPVRRKIREALLSRSPSRDPGENGEGNKFRILVVGGSQGARGLNRLFLAALSRIPPALRDRLLIRHQTGSADLEEVEAAYRALGLSARVEPFINDMASAYLEAELVVSRAGAGAVAEIALAGLPAVFVPYPYAASDHQAENARALVEAGAAVMFREQETDPARFAETIAELARDRSLRNAMAEKARAAAFPEAASRIVDLCLELMEGGEEKVKVEPR